MRLDRDVAPGVHRVCDAHVNWYLVEEDGRLTAVDAGLPASWGSLRAAVAELGRRPGDVDAVVLTHGHFDHVGFAERARRELGARVLCPAGDVEIAGHPLRYPHERSRALYLSRPRPFAMFARMIAAGAFAPRPPRELERYADRDVLDVPGSPRVVATPGHTPGHCSLDLPARGAVIAGDALVTLDVYTARRGPRLVARAATADGERALASLDELAATDAGVVLPGHGDPWTGGAAEAARLAREAGAA